MPENQEHKESLCKSCVNWRFHYHTFIDGDGVEYNVEGYSCDLFERPEVFVTYCQAYQKKDNG